MNDKWPHICGYPGDDCPDHPTTDDPLFCPATGLPHRYHGTNVAGSEPDGCMDCDWGERVMVSEGPEPF